MSKELDSKTEVLNFVRLAWENRAEAAPFSYDRLNRTMRRAVLLAVEIGFEFTADDLRYIYKYFKAGYYLGIEGFYGLAVTTSNRSAASASREWLRER